MKSLLKLALAFGITAAFVDLMMRRAAARAASLPTLHGVEDADPNLPEPLADADLKVAQNAPF